MPPDLPAELPRPARVRRRGVNVTDLATPVLVADAAGLAHNIATMAAARPGDALRPHLKAHKCTGLAREQAAAGHRRFCGATAAELLGAATAGLGDDLLLANECLDLDRLSALAHCGARITVAVDSPATVAAATASGIREVLVDVNVGLPRGGCDPEDAGAIADTARRAGLDVRGVMGYEGHAVGLADADLRARLAAEAAATLVSAHEAVGGEVVSAGGTGTFAAHPATTEVQAGSYVLMDTHYATLGLPFVEALGVVATIVSVSRRGGYVVADAGLKALGMDHGNPLVRLIDADESAGEVWFASDEHLTFAPADGVTLTTGDRVWIRPAHVDPTVAMHDTLVVADNGVVTERWPIDLRGW